MDSWTLQHKVKQQLYVAVRNPINNPNSEIHSFSTLVSCEHKKKYK